MSTKLMRSGPARLFNSLVLRFAGTRYFPLYGVIEHRGRSSGKIFHTPVVVRPVADGFVVPMPWGERTDWYRNVRAAGSCTIRWKGRYHQVDRLETVDTRAVMSAFNSFERAIMACLGITQCLRLHHQTWPVEREADCRLAKSRYSNRNPDSRARRSGPLFTGVRGR